MSNADQSETPIPAHVSNYVAWASIGGFWAFYYVINSIRMAVQGEQGQWQMLGKRAVVTASGIVLTWLLQILLRRLENRSLTVLVTTAFAAAVPLAATYASINFLMFYLYRPNELDLEDMQKQHGPVGIIADTGLTWYFFVVAWAVLYIALVYAMKVRRAERTASLYRVEAQTAQLRALRYQVNPHFLFNTLNSLSTLVLQSRNAEAERVIMNLSTFFRSSLATEMDDEIPLAEEIRIQRLYLDIEQVRFPERLRVRIDVPPGVETAAVPCMLLQPLVENVVKHGVAHSTRPVTLTIRAQPKGADRLCIVVEDDAGSVESQCQAASGTGHIGLHNVCARLAGRYGDRSSCDYGPRPEGGFRVTLMFPLKRLA